MKVIQISEANTKEIVSLLQQGSVLVLPTDTVYGLIVDAKNSEAIQKIVRIKERDKKKPLGIFVKDIIMAKEYAVISKENEEYLNKVWPGKITAVLSLRKDMTPGLGTETTIGIRVPDSSLLVDIMEQLGGPLVQTSVNISGEPSCKNVQEIMNVFEKREHQPEIIVDAGDLSQAQPSQVIDLTGDMPITLRK